MRQSYPSIYLIPEWAEQSAVLLAWPYADTGFSPWLAAVESTYDRIAYEISLRETLIIVYQDETHRENIARRLRAVSANSGEILFVAAPYDDVWVRDTAPLAVQTPEGVRLVDFRFNGWGGKYPHAGDAELAANLHASGLFGNIPFDRFDFVLEGGSIESDGAGTILTTSRCLLHPKRNPNFSQVQIEEGLRRMLGAERILWLDHGYAEGDDTDAHVDTLARFCSEEIIAYTDCDRPDDSLYGEFKTMAEQLQTFRNVSGQPYRLIPLPIPDPIHDEDGARLPATYANFLIINGAVLLPVYGDSRDTVAASRLADCFPGREIVAIDCVPLIRQYGSLHCMTMQFPAALGFSK